MSDTVKLDPNAPPGQITGDEVQLLERIDANLKVLIQMFAAAWDLDVADFDLEDK